MRWVALVTLAGAALMPVCATAECRIAKAGTLPVNLHGNRPFVTARINDQNIDVLIDTGAGISAIGKQTAARTGLRPSFVRHKLFAGNEATFGVMNRTRIFMPANPIQPYGEPDVAVIVDSLTIGDLDLSGERWWVLDDAAINGDEFGMILGSDSLARTDVEFDFAGGQIILWKIDDCASAPLAYWSRSYMLAGLEHSPSGRIEATATVNGRRIRALLDTAANYSVMSLHMAYALGLKKDFLLAHPGPPVSLVGLHGSLPGYVASFETFELGDLAVRNPTLIVADLDRGAMEDHFPWDLVLGADFFRANRIFVARGQDKMYFTYGGGTIFNLRDSGADNDASLGGAASQ